MNDSVPATETGSVTPGPELLGRSILVVEDSRSQREFAVALIQTMGASAVFEAANGIDALGVLEREPGIDLVFCDLEMPFMDGMALIEAMASRAMDPHLVILSSHDAGVLESVRLMAVSYGISLPGIIAKPLTRDKIIQVLGTLPPSRAVPRPASPQASFSNLEIRRGMKKGEFECFYQPQITMLGNQLSGAEALVRWRHPDLGIMAPGSFLPQIEKIPELMSRLTLDILEQVARQWHEWRAGGLELDISVNLSAVSLSSAGFADRITEAVARHDLPAEALVLEITESASIANLGHTLANLARLRMRGFKLSIDDFGTGYATYAQLERIPFTELKLDISVTRELPASQRHAILARSLIQLAKDLNLRTVAEGIETQACWDALKRLGCDRGQGYHLGRPMPGDQLPPWALQDRSHL